MPNGRLVKLEALKSDADDGYFVHCDADMRWVVHSSDATLNLSESLVQGFKWWILWILCWTVTFTAWRLWLVATTFRLDPFSRRSASMAVGGTHRRRASDS